MAPIAETKIVTLSSIPNNLGIVVKAARILDFEPLLATMR